MTQPSGSDAVELHPDELWDVVRDLPLAEVLWLREEIGHGAPDSAEQRHFPMAGQLQVAVAFRRGDRWAAVVPEGGGAVSPVHWGRLAHADPQSPMARARGLFESLWDRADPAHGAPRLVPGTAVRLEGSSEVWTVDSPQRHDRDGWMYRLRDASGLTSIEAHESGLVVVERDDLGLRDRLGEPPGSAKDLVLRLAHLKLSTPLTDVVYSYQATKTLFRAYQFRPLLRLLASPHQRLLIADEVGLGKTIEAGLVWTELDQRSGVNRALVVCPATLVHKWRDELERRFDRRVQAVDAQRLREMTALLTRDPEAPFQGVVSLEALRISPELEQLAALGPRLDLVIVDEAHYLRNRGTKSHALGQLLSDWADHLLFLSATPLNLGQSDLFNLLNLLAEEEFRDASVFEDQMEPNKHLNRLAKDLLANRHQPRTLLPHLEDMLGTTYGAIAAGRPEFGELRTLLSTPEPLTPAEVAEARRLLTELNSLATILTRTRKADTKEAKVLRQAWPIDVEWSSDEAALYLAVQQWARARALQSNGVVGFATQMPLRQAASCLPALIRKLRAKHPELRASQDDLDDLPLDDPALDDARPDARDLDDQDVEALSGTVRSLMQRVDGTDTKYDRFAEELGRLRAAGVTQVMVFSFFRGTLQYLLDRLATDGQSVRKMDGGTPMADRVRLMQEFRDGAFEILLLSEVGSEGLDFEFCQALVNYDLPWNPIRVEQRIGRLDRFGQRHERIFILNFHVPGTIETEIFERLYLRIRVFEESIGELEPILRDEVNLLTKTVLDPGLSDEEREAQLDRIAVAMEEYARDLKTIEQSEGMLAGIDQLLVDGLERKTKEQGRFIGRTELRAVIEELLRDTGARLRGRATARVLELQGSGELRDRIAALGVRGGSSRYSIAHLLATFNDKLPLAVTLDNEEAASSGVELISPLHPLAVAAVRHLSDRSAQPPWFSHVRLSEGESRRLVGYWVAKTTGLRPSMEIWSAAIELTSGKPDDVVGDEVLDAAATGRLLEPFERVRGVDLEADFDEVQRIVDERRRALEVARRSSNEALVDARIRARHDAIDHKVRMAQSALQQQWDPSIRRLHEGRIRNLSVDRAQVEGEMNGKRGLTIALRPAAVVLVDG